MIATIALLVCPVAIFALFRKFDLPVALVASLIGSYLLLPQSELIDLPALPPLERDNIPLLTVLVLTIFALRQTEREPAAPSGWLPRDPVTLLFMALFVFGAFMTARSNGDVLRYGDRVIQGMKTYDALSILLNAAMLMIAFSLGRRVLYSANGQKVLAMGLVVGLLCYVPLVLYELRMSPQLHMNLYGFFPHSFAQHMRGDGFRPVVFLDHGLSLSLLLACGVIAAIGLMRGGGGDQRLKWACAAACLFAVMVLSKSLGPLLIACVLIPFALFAKSRIQLLVAAGVAAMVLTYPVLRSTHVVPLDQVTSFARSIDEGRARSFLVRLNNEEELLAKAQERPLFGWGIWGRGRVYDDRGNNLSTTDGLWVLTLGSGGWVRYIAFFGLLSWPIIALLFVQRDKIDPICAALALILCAKLIDLIPNSGVPLLYFLIAGSLLGRLEMRELTTEASQNNAPPAAGHMHGRKARKGPREPGPAYARSFPGSGITRKPDATRKERPAPSYRRPSPNGSYRR